MADKHLQEPEERSGPRSFGSQATGRVDAKPAIRGQLHPRLPPWTGWKKTVHFPTKYT